MDYRMLAIRFSGALWSRGICPECGNDVTHHLHFASCKKTYEKLENPRDIEKVFIEAFETPSK